jgi:hypothetical protein
MLKHRTIAAILGRVGVVLLIVVAVGCGDNRQKITRPDNPTPVPDPSKRMTSDTEHAPTPQQQK